MTAAATPADSAPVGAPRRRRGALDPAKRTGTLSIRLTAAQRDQLNAAAQARGRGPSETARKAVLAALEGTPTLPRRRPQPQADPAVLRQLLAELGKLGSNVNQQAHRLNAAYAAGKHVAPRVELLEQQLAEVRALRAALVDALGQQEQES